MIMKNRQMYQNMHNLVYLCLLAFAWMPLSFSMVPLELKNPPTSKRSSSSMMKEDMFDNKKKKNTLQRRRKAEYSADEDFSSFLVDKNGNEYEPYSMAWRYLGMYMDCDFDAVANGDDDASGSNDEGECDRVVLWAAYVDPRYKGGSIGEYQFYDLEAETWDDSTCQGRRCVKMDCHEPGTHFKLIGVYKEIDGMEDWAEQLFKHEGYCIWDEDTYEFMSNYREYWPSYCQELYYTDSSGNAVYFDTQPTSEGNITFGLYTDNACTQLSDYTIFNYIATYYSSSGVTFYKKLVNYWNSYMDVYKICQPCRAYNLNKNGDSGSQDESHDGRFLENDGEGDDEQWGYNCYDDAGYTNCNQCYKFETKTDLEEATADDLAQASKQGTILEIKYKGKTYGSGGIRSSSDSNTGILAPLLVLSVGFAFTVYWVTRKNSALEYNLEKHLPKSFQEKLSTAPAEEVTIVFEATQDKRVSTAPTEGTTIAFEETQEKKLSTAAREEADTPYDETHGNLPCKGGVFI